MSGYHSQRAMGDFIRKHWNALNIFFRPKNGRLPSYQTVARVISGIRFEELNKVFYEWAKEYVEIDKGDYLSLDGKVIGGTVTNPQNCFQEYVNLVSVFSHDRKQILALDKVKDKGSEISTVKKLIKELDLEGVIFTLDALHCQKETVKTIIESKNNYIIGVKRNQGNLYNQIEENIKKGIPVDSDTRIEKNRGREEVRIAQVYNDLNNISNDWIGLQTILKIERMTKTHKKESKETAYYISSLPANTLAGEFNQAVRNHWSIENSLHYIKDKTFGEDKSKIRKGSAPQNLSIIRNIAINIFRNQGYDNIAQAIRLVSDDIRKIYQMISA